MFLLSRRSAKRLLFAALMLAFVNTPGWAEGPQGQFLCRRQEPPPPDSGGGYFINVATMRLRADGSYQAKDLTTSIPEVHGHFTYDAKAKTIEWDSGIWKTLLGHFVPNPSGKPLFVVTTKKDPEGKVDGTFQCVRSSR